VTEPHPKHQAPLTMALRSGTSTRGANGDTGHEIYSNNFRLRTASVTILSLIWNKEARLASFLRIAGPFTAPLLARSCRSGLSAIGSLSREKRTSGGHPISVAIDSLMRHEIQ
jgi:hypothetical protein